VQSMQAVPLPVLPWSTTVVGFAAVVVPTDSQLVTGLGNGQSGPPPTTAAMNASAGGAVPPWPPLQLPDPPLLLLLLLLLLGVWYGSDDETNS